METKRPVAYDVLGVGLKNKKVRLLATGKSERNAEAIVGMAVVRHSPGDQGMDVPEDEQEFFAVVPTGTYKDGDEYTGGSV